VAPIRYEIEVRGAVGPALAQAFAGFDVVAAGGTTLLVGCIEDQSALLGLIGRVSDFGLDLVAVRPVGSQ
jgi:hypothetical protein